MKVNMKSKHTPQTKNYSVEDICSSESHGLPFSTSGLEVIFFTFLSNCGKGVYSDPSRGCSRAVESNSNLKTVCRVWTVLFYKILWQDNGRVRLLEFSLVLTICY